MAKMAKLTKIEFFKYMILSISFATPQNELSTMPFVLAKTGNTLLWRKPLHWQGLFWNSRRLPTVV
jgi:hypothetical protein